MKTKSEPRCGYGRKDWQYNPNCHCCRCSVTRLLDKQMARLTA